jgi:hypothetical protein
MPAKKAYRKTAKTLTGLFALGEGAGKDVVAQALLQREQERQLQEHLAAAWGTTDRTQQARLACQVLAEAAGMEHRQMEQTSEQERLEMLAVRTLSGNPYTVVALRIYLDMLAEYGTTTAELQAQVVKLKGSKRTLTDEDRRRAAKKKKQQAANTTWRKKMNRLVDSRCEGRTQEENEAMSRSRLATLLLNQLPDNKPKPKKNTVRQAIAERMRQKKYISSREG